jgi:hypothetical protein
MSPAPSSSSRHHHLPLLTEKIGPPPINREAFNHEKWDLEAKLKKVMEARSKVERALEVVAAIRDETLSKLERGKKEN